MTKSRSFSIFLLKENFNAGNALKDDNVLRSDFDAAALPAGAELFVLDAPSKPPWWKGYFGIDGNLNQSSKGALVIFPVQDRHFALSFGHVFHNLKDTSYEYDFGLRVTLNSLDPDRLKSTDVLEPGASRRRRTQLPIESDLTFFDFDRDSTVLKSLTGKVKDEYKELFRHATGASNLRVSSDFQSNKLIELCERLLQIYSSEEYKETFPDIQNIVPIRDPILIEQLDAKLIAAIQAKDEGLNLTVPDLINYSDNAYASFSGCGESDNFEDVFMERYFEYLEKHDFDLATIQISNLRKHQLLLTDEHGSIKDHYTIYKSLVFDLNHGGENETFHLSEGHWYKIETDYVLKLRTSLDPLCIDLPLPPYNHDGEDTYNAHIPGVMPSLICLDKKNISPMGQTQIEPCDLYGPDGDKGVFYHVKVSTFSSQLSHQFNQGANAVEILKLEDAAIEKLRELVTELAPHHIRDQMLSPLVSKKFQVIFAVITHKDKAAKSDNLPLFSRISLMRVMKALRVMSVDAAFGFVPDASPKKVGRRKTKKAA
ncbi:DUF6119 family protein [Tardiphaga sp. 42S5]|uniref:DUF6119 family protein n=1 Tax=Tardiphaga sp. 42S5 TaxID=1404799 RepID=UPI002A5A1ADF|nr:DUF6119 family protein [Tardiphaga sp. 42S5]WPO43118.1 TIGR04141 family sporadically distributed protein [Tardiphaga sp. 42S5]